MKTLELLALLSSKEKRQFENTVIKTHKRNSLVQLYRFLKKNKEVDKDKLFVKVFGHKYDSKQDSLLRNELRLLNKELENFFSDLQWLREQQNNPERAQLLLLQLYSERQQEHLFEQHWRKLYKKAKEEQRYELKVELINAYFDYHSRYSNVAADLYQQLEELIEEGLEACSAQSQEEHKNLEARYGFLERNLWAINSGQYELKQPPKFYEMTSKVENDAFIAFSSIATQASYYATGEDKLPLLKQAIAQGQALENSPQYERIRERLQNLQVTLGVEYYILKRYEEANVIYERVLSRPLLGSIRSRVGTTFNYFTNLLGLKNYEQAIICYREQESLWMNLPPVAYKAQYMVCWAYHETKQYKAALDLLLSHNIQQRSEGEFAYARLMLSITYAALGEQELAEREVYNLLQNTRYKDFKESISIAYSKFIHQYFLAMHTLDPDKRNAKLAQIRADLEEMYRANLNFSSTFLYRWLVQHLEAAAL